MTTLLFDLDGTLVDSSQGILAAFRHSFAHLNQPCPDQAELMTFIGPPLEKTFAHCFDSQEMIEQALAAFRAYYHQQGVYETQLYPEIKEVLADLVAAGHQLFVTTSKNEPMAKLMLENLGVSPMFTAIYGAVENRQDKADVIRACLLDHDLEASDTFIVGDTKYDMIGGNVAGIGTLGVTWGFGSRQDLLEHGACHIIDRPSDLLEDLFT